MAKKIGISATGTGDVPLRLANVIAVLARKSFDGGNGEMMEKVSPTTAELLKYWFCEPYTQERNVNFHEGQRQSILNAIYLHEVCGIKNVRGIYESVAPELLSEGSIFSELDKGKYAFPKYAIKMATGTGKTWVMHALLLWQYLNAKAEKGVPSGRWTKNFLLVAPGLIVYDRLLDAYCGRTISADSEERDFATSDISKFRELFLPPNFRERVFGFVQNNVVRKEDFGRKVTGDGMIALTNWHLFMNSDGDDEKNAGEYEKIVRDLLPARPGMASGNALDSLDKAHLRGGELSFIEELPDLMVVNDEAHHIHENKKYGEIEEVEWQAGLNRIAENKGERFFQIDFSATPYDTAGTGANAKKHFFPHIISDFPLENAIRGGLVKMIAIDKRKSLTELNTLDFKAIRAENGRTAIALSDGQRLMLRAGLQKLKILESEFLALDEKKSPKMLVICEDTSVSPLVEIFLRDEGLTDENILRVDSNRSGEMTAESWREVKRRLFGIDSSKNCKVVISVLMLREGFDVSNICVIVPLRASNAPILLEQTIGRGLRLMWREPEYAETKADTRRKILQEKTEPDSYLDILSIVEHPAFSGFYDELFAGGLAFADEADLENGGSIGDLMKVGLKENFEKYDLFFPIVLRDEEENIVPAKIEFEKMEPFTTFPLEQLRKIFAKDGEVFVSRDLMAKTLFGEYRVRANLFTAESYNEYLQKLMTSLLSRIERVNSRKTITLPALQINVGDIAAIIDTYIRSRLFDQPFNPFEGNDWKILLAQNGLVTAHIIKEISKVIYEMQMNTEKTTSEADKLYFSRIRELRVRESFSLPLQKTIYERTPFPSNKGNFEKDILLFLDDDAKVESFIKISESQHDFAKIFYLREDGLLASYHPDFLIKTKDKIYLAETKAETMLSSANVRSKQLAAIEWCKRINALGSELRMNREWVYVLIGENLFYGMRSANATIEDICELATVKAEKLRDDLNLFNEF